MLIKPKSLSVKDFLIRKMSIKLNMSEQIIEKIISHQFQSASEAMVINKSVEISGFGKFFFNDKKAVTRMKRNISKKEVFTAIMNNEAETDRRRKSAETKLKDTLKDIEILKPKVNEFITDIRGLEESFDSFKES